VGKDGKASNKLTMLNYIFISHHAAAEHKKSCQAKIDGLRAAVTAILWLTLDTAAITDAAAFFDMFTEQSETTFTEFARKNVSKE